MAAPSLQGIALIHGIPFYDEVATTNDAYAGITRATTPMWRSQPSYTWEQTTTQSLQGWSYWIDTYFNRNMLDPDLRLPEGI